MATHPPLGVTEIASGDLNHHTAEVLTRVEAGETLTITRHGVVIAVLSPARAHPLAAMVRAGLVEPAVQQYFQTEPW